MADEEWTPQAAERAFKTFGNLMLQVNAVYEKFGHRTPENEREGAMQIVQYLEGLSTEQLMQIVGYFEYVELARDNVLLTIGMIMLSREAKESYGR